MNNLNEFTKELESLLNRYSMEGYWDMPDYLMAKFITNMITETSDQMKGNLVWHGNVSTATRRNCNEVIINQETPQDSAKRHQQLAKDFKEDGY